MYAVHMVYICNVSCNAFHVLYVVYVLKLMQYWNINVHNVCSGCSVCNEYWLAGWLADELSEGDESVVRICANE